MITGFIVTFFICLIIFVILKIKRNKEALAITLLSSLPTLFVVLILNIVVFSTGIIEIKSYVKEKEPLISLYTSSATEGSFFLGIGEINSKMYFFYYTKKNGYIVLKKVSFEEAKIKYTNKKPCIVTIERYGIFKWNKICTRKIIYVPEGSIKVNFNFAIK